LTDALIAYALFLAKALTIAALVGAVLVAVVRARRGSQAAEEHIEITDLNDRYRETGRALKRATLSGRAYRKAVRLEQKEDKAREKAGGKARRRVFVIDFRGDIKASEVAALRECITAVLLVAGKTTDEGEDAGGRATQGAVADEGKDARGRATQRAVADEGKDARGRATQGAVAEVVVRLDNAGGLVAEHGLAASQLARLRAHKIPLTVTVDKVAASGGYLMACVADRILAAPFAVVGSIGVVAQLPNFHRVLERHGVDFELHTAGEYKRTLTLFGENTEAGREKLREQIEETHRLFKDYIAEYRPGLDLTRAATGEYWHGRQALDLGLVDTIQTSDDYLLDIHARADLLHLKYTGRKRPIERLLANIGGALQRALG
jgi:serine protease SohB